MERMADEAYPDWRDLFQQTQRRLPFAMNDEPGKWATRKVAHFGRLLLLASEITLQELLYYGGILRKRKPAGVGPS